MSQPDAIDLIRVEWAKEKPRWPTPIAHAAKRKRLGLSLDMPLGTDKDHYLRYMEDDALRAEYMAACETIQAYRAHKNADAAKLDAAIDTVWNYRRQIVEHLPEVL